LTKQALFRPGIDFVISLFSSIERWSLNLPRPPRLNPYDNSVSYKQKDPLQNENLLQSLDLLFKNWKTYLVSIQKRENLVKFKADKNFNHRNTRSILRIKIFIQRRNWAN
jgi:hypothetical protein